MKYSNTSASGSLSRIRWENFREYMQQTREQYLL